MAKFKELNKNMLEVLQALCENQNLCKLLSYNEEDALSKPDIENTDNLLYKKIFPHPFSLDLTTDVGSLLAVTFDKFKPTSGNGYKNGLLVFRIVCHHDIWRTEDGLRPYLILHEIDEVINGKRNVGIGKLRFVGCNELWANNKFSGFTLVYETTDFN